MPLPAAGRNAGEKVTGEGFNAMGKVLKFDARKLVRKDKPMAERGMTGKVIEFRQQKSINNSENAETRKPDEAIAQAAFSWSL
jgi:hypothetical protein